MPSFVASKIRRRAVQQFDRIAKHPNGCIAPATEDATNLAGRVIVINSRPAHLPSASDGLARSADFTDVGCEPVTQSTFVFNPVMLSTPAGSKALAALAAETTGIRAAIGSLAGERNLASRTDCGGWSRHTPFSPVSEGADHSVWLVVGQPTACAEAVSA